MIKFENAEVSGWESAIRGMRNPLQSHDKIDSGWGASGICVEKDIDDNQWCIGENDKALMMKLRNAGTDHRKFMRMITVWVDITAPDYFFKEFSTYRVGVTENSTSTMHKIHAKEFTLNDFSCEHLTSDDYSVCHTIRDDMDGGHYEAPLDTLEQIIEMLNVCREKYLVALKTEEETGMSAKDIWWQMIQLLPMSYNYCRTVCLNYEVLANMYHSRKAHKLDEWRIGFCDWVKSLPYSELITGEV